MVLRILQCGVENWRTIPNIHTKKRLNKFYKLNRTSHFQQRNWITKKMQMDENDIMALFGCGDNMGKVLKTQNK